MSASRAPDSSQPAERSPSHAEGTSLVHTARRVALACSVVVTAVGALVLAGWISGTEGLKSLVGAVTMKANMAIGLVACGLALGAIVTWPRAARPPVIVLAGLAGVIGALTLSQHAFGWNLGIDELMFAEAPGALATASPGRMGPNGSLSLILSGLALLSLSRGTAAGAARAQLLATLVATLALVALIGYWYEARELYDIARYTGIAFPTAFAFLGLSVGVLAARADAGPMGTFTAPGPGGVMARRVLMPAVVVPLVLGYLEVLGQRAGLYETGLGTALFAIVLVAILVSLIARTALIVNAAAAQQRETEQALLMSERDFATMLRSLPIAVAVSRLSDGTIVDVNDAFTTLTKFTREEVLGKTNRELRLNRDDAGRERLLEAVARDGAVRDADVRYFPKSGEPRDVVVNLSVIELQGAKHLLSTTLDITERKRAEEALRRTTAFDEAVMTNMGEGLYTVDAEGLVTFMNPEAEKLFGWTLDELRGQKMHLVTHYKHRDGSPFPIEECAGFRVLRQGQTVTDHEDVFIRKDGTFFDVVYSSAPLTEHGVTTGLVVVLRDVTERKRIEQALRDSEQRFKHAADVAESANRLKDQFLATLSHELRTPLNAILGYARMLRTDVLPGAKRAHAIEIIERNAVIQNQLVEDLLDISRMTTGRIRLEMEMIPIAGPLQEAIESVRPTADAKGVELQIDVDPFAGAVHADPGRLQQVFWNLLSNAVKFTPPGGRVTVSLASEDGSVQATVQDSGIGIPHEFLPFVFDAFRQADAGFSREFGGLGLGLAICKQLVDLHAGTLTAASDGPGSGATFTVRLPRRAANAGLRRDAPAREQARSATGRLTGIDILVVDDQEDSVELLRHLLEEAGASVRTAANAFDALREFEERLPDLLVADIGLPQMDGLELLRRIRGSSRENGSSVPAVAVTAYGRSDDRRRAQEAGYQAHIPKPIDPEVFLQTVAAAVRERA